MRRSVDLLFVAFVVTVGLSIGQQLIDWWREDPTTAQRSGLSRVVGSELDWSHVPVTLQFGDAETSMGRVPFQGTRKQLEEKLTQLGQSIVTSSEQPPSTISQAEREWLDTLRLLPPVFWESDRGNVYYKTVPLPSFIATRFVDVDEADANPENAVTQRIVGWGMAFPVTPQDWTIYVFRPQAAQGRSDESLQFDLPRGARNIAQLTGANGCQWQVFQGRGDAVSWIQHFDGQFGGKSRESLVDHSQITSVRYRLDRRVTDIQVRQDSDGQLTGVLWSTQEGESQ